MEPTKAIATFYGYGGEKFLYSKIMQSYMCHRLYRVPTFSEPYPLCSYEDNPLESSITPPVIDLEFRLMETVKFDSHIRVMYWQVGGPGA